MCELEPDPLSSMDSAVDDNFRIFRVAHTNRIDRSIFMTLPNTW